MYKVYLFDNMYIQNNIQYVHERGWVLKIYCQNGRAESMPYLRTLPLYVV